jgi:hypothetical protein
VENASTSRTLPSRWRCGSIVAVYPAWSMHVPFSWGDPVAYARVIETTMLGLPR